MFQRLSLIEKRKAIALKARERFRCTRCRVTVEDKDRAGHLERCMPDVLADKFEKG
jgi:hypothetical protein